MNDPLGPALSEQCNVLIALGRYLIGLSHIICTACIQLRKTNHKLELKLAPMETVMMTSKADQPYQDD